jgi:acyl carrier protein
MEIACAHIVDLIERAGVIAEPRKLRYDVTLMAQGVDSLGLFSVLLLVEETYGVKIPDADVNGLATIQDIVDHLTARLA